MLEWLKLRLKYVGRKLGENWKGKRHGGRVVFILLRGRRLLAGNRL